MRKMLMEFLKIKIIIIIIIRGKLIRNKDATILIANWQCDHLNSDTPARRGKIGLYIIL